MPFDGLRNFVEITLIALAALLPIVDPLGGAPIYLAMITELSPPERVRTARLVAINSFVLLAASILIGAYVLDFFRGIDPCRTGWGRIHRLCHCVVTSVEPQLAGRIGQDIDSLQRRPKPAGLLSTHHATDRWAGFDFGGHHARSESASRPSTSADDSSCPCSGGADHGAVGLLLLPVCGSNLATARQDRYPRTDPTHRIHSILYWRSDHVERRAIPDPERAQAGRRFLRENVRRRCHVFF